MASTAVLGFLKGGSTEALDSIHRRDQMEQELAKEKLLEQLRLQTNEEYAKFTDNLHKDDIANDLTSPDYTTGKVTYRNKNGDVVRVRDMTDSEKQDYQDKKDKFALDKKNVESEIGYRNTQAGVEQQRLGIEASNARTAARRADIEEDQYRTSKRAAGFTTLDGNPVAKNEYDQTIADLTKAGANPRVLASFQNKWQEGLNNGWTLGQQKTFLQEMRYQFTVSGTYPNDGGKPGGKPGRALLDQFPNVDPKLEGIMATNSGQ